MCRVSPRSRMPNSTTDFVQSTRVADRYEVFLFNQILQSSHSERALALRWVSLMTRVPPAPGACPVQPALPGPQDRMVCFPLLH